MSSSPPAVETGGTSPAAPPALGPHAADPLRERAPRPPRPRIHPAVALGLVLLLPLVLLSAVSGFAVTLPQPSPIPSWTAAQPAIRGDFPDPAVLVVGPTYYAYATNASGKHVQVASSTDLRYWTLLPDALPVLPSWADAGGDWVWAPSVLQIGERFVMYYTARDSASGRQCVGAATSASPSGPFADASARPFLCQPSLGGTIDPAPFRDGDALYLYFKSDGNCCHQPTYLWGQQLAPDGLSLVGAPVSLVTNDQPWEGDVVEAPSMLLHDGRYDLFYSGNDYATDRYAVGYATCRSPLGPCQKTAPGPILASVPGSSAPLAGPGGEAFFQAGGSTWIAFHAWSVTGTGALGASRYLLIERLGWHGGTPVVLPPSSAPPPYAPPGS